MNFRWKPIVFSTVHMLAAAAVYRYLISGGWLTNHYQLNDPNVVNLLLAMFEPIAVLSVIAYWLARKPFLYRLMFILFLVQLLIGAGFLLFILFFFITWKPKMM